MREWYERDSTPESELRRQFSIRGMIFTTFVIGGLCALRWYGLEGGDLVIAAVYFSSHAVVVYMCIVFVLRMPPE